jgi:hypothetical protein
MPDPQMPYDGNYSDYQQQQQQMQMPQSNMAFNNNYMQNNSMLMNMGQSNIQATMATASYNFHQHMQDVLQGTMASAMAIYNTGRSAVDKSRETVYQDQLMGNGIFALERSTWRDVAWGTGLAGSDFGRALKIGGRRPEFMTGGEYTYQMNRSFEHRKDEWQDELVAGGATALGSYVGMTFGPPGLVAGMATGYVVDQTLGKLVQPYLDKRAVTREMRQFTEMADLNQGVGQRRMSQESSDALATEFYEHDTSRLKYVPFIGKSLDKRYGYEIKEQDVFKKMAQFDLMRDINPDDVDKITERIKDTAKVMDKFAGLLHVTRDKIAEIKGKFNAIGMNNSQQDNALSNLAKFTTATGYDTDSALALQDSFIGIGRQGNYFRTGSEQLQGGYGLAQVASIMALQNSGLISKSFDAGTLGQKFYANAVDQSRDTWHRVTEFGDGDVTKTREYYEKQGHGNAILGMELEGIAMYGKKGNPLEEYRKNIDKTIEVLMTKSRMTREEAQAYILRREKDPAGKEQAFEAISGISNLSESAGQALYINRALERQGSGDRISSYKIGDIFNVASKGLDFSSNKNYVLTNQGRAKNAYDAMMLSDPLNKESGRTFQNYKNAIGDSDVEHLLYQQYTLAANGSENIEENEKKLIKTLQEKGMAGSDNEALQIIRNYERNKNDKQHVWEKTANRSVGNKMVDFMEMYRSSARVALDPENQEKYKKIQNKQMSSKELDELKESLDSTSDRSIKLSILQKAGFGIEINGTNGLNKTIIASEMAFNDYYKYKKGYTKKDEDTVKQINNAYATLSTNNGGLLQSLGIKSEQDYVNKFGSAGKDINSLMNGGKLDKKSESQLAKDLALVTGSDMDTGERMAKYLGTASTDEVQTFMTHVAQQDFSILGQAGRDFAKNGNFGSMTNDPQTDAIKEFTNTCKALTEALTKHK